MESIATWVAPIATTIAALMTASNLGSRITGYGFIVFTTASSPRSPPPTLPRPND